MAELSMVFILESAHTADNAQISQLRKNHANEAKLGLYDDALYGLSDLTYNTIAAVDELYSVKCYPGG